MALKQETIEFNLQVISGEVGAILGGPTSSFIASQYTSTRDIISAAAVLGSIIGGAILFLSLRVYHKSKKEDHSGGKFVNELAYFTPAAFILTLLFYYPTLFFLSRELQTHYSVIIAVIMSQVTAFILFLSAINLYRVLLMRYTGKIL